MTESTKEMFADMDLEQMCSMMEAMPDMVEHCCSEMNAQEAGSFVQDMMPKMMESCFANLDARQGQEILDMCREMLDRIESEYQGRRV